MTLRCAALHAQPALGCWLPCNYLTALTEFRNREKPQSHLWDLEEGREMKRHSKNADSPVLNLPWPVCGKGRAAGLAGAGRAIPGLGSWTRPTLHRPRSEGVAPKFHVLREGTMARGSATSSGCRAGCGENKGKGALKGGPWMLGIDHGREQVSEFATHCEALPEDTPSSSPTWRKLRDYASNQW